MMRLPPSPDPKFPVKYYRHPGTGVVVEVDSDGLCTLTPYVGDFRTFKDMRESRFGFKTLWNANDETAILLKHGWEPVSTERRMR